MEVKQGLKRNTIDKFYTKDEIVNKCIDEIKKNLEINKNDLIIEPSAGNGAFINQIKSLSNNYYFCDIEPEQKEIIKEDFLTLDNTINKKYKKIHIIGNPPFGRQSSIAIKFIKKSCEISNSISFILPKSFKKKSLQRYFDLNFHLIKEINIPDNSFLMDNKEVNVPCIFQIWEKKKEKRLIDKKLIPNNFLFVSKEENPDFSFRRVGVNAGNVSTNYQDKNIQSHYFIKLINQNNKNKLIEEIKKIKFPFDNTVGPKSISKQELIKEFNKIIN